MNRLKFTVPIQYVDATIKENAIKRSVSSYKKYRGQIWNDQIEDDGYEEYKEHMLFNKRNGGIYD